MFPLGEGGMGSDYLMGTACSYEVIKKFWNQRELVVAQHCEYI